MCKDTFVNCFSLLNKQDNKTQMEVSNFLIILSMLVDLVALMLMRRSNSVMEADSKIYIDLPSSYSIMLRRLPKGYTEEDILDMISTKRSHLTTQELESTGNLSVEKITLSYSLREII